MALQDDNEDWSKNRPRVRNMLERRNEEKLSFRCQYQAISILYLNIEESDFNQAQKIKIP